MKTIAVPSEKKAHPIRRLKRILLQRFLVILFIVLQFGLWIAILSTGAIHARVLSYAFQAIGVLLSLYVVSLSEPMAYKLLWIFFLLVFPAAGIVCFLFLKGRGTARRYRHLVPGGLPADEAFASPPHDSVVDGSYRRLVRYLSHKKYPLTANTESTYFPVGEKKFEALLPALRAAKKYIFLEYFIIDEGKMWDDILAILKEKAAQGLDVRILMDDIGCFLLRPRHFAKDLLKCGISVTVFNRLSPFITSARNYRDHRKIVSIDGKVAFTGGVNIGDEYINRRPRFGHWKDTAVMLRGRGAWALTLIFLTMWNACRRIRDEDLSIYRPTEEFFNSVEGDGYVVAYADSPAEEALIKNMYLSAAFAAEKYLYITTPYLILDDSLLDALTAAAKSGTDVRIVTPRIADKKMVNVVTKSFYGPLLDAGVRIYEYTPGFIHAKNFIADGKIAGVGSANLDYRSLYLSFESGVLFTGGRIVREIDNDFHTVFAASREIKSARKGKKSALAALFAQFLRLFAPLM